MSWPLLFGGGESPQASIGNGPPIGLITFDRQIFRLNGEPWQWLGASFFPGCHLFEKGGPAAVDPFIDAYPGCRIFRVWDYVTWPQGGWEASPPDVWVAFLRHLHSRGKFVTRTALTDDDRRRIDPAKRTIERITDAGCDNVFHEGGNEPNTHKEIQTHELISVMQASGRPWCTGDYENSVYWRGTHGLYHPARTADFARRGHDALEYFMGGGPNSRSEPACRVPWVNDEPAKLQDVPKDWAAWRAHIAASFLFGGGITIHHETGKYGRLPTEEETILWNLALEVMRMIRPDAALGPYRRIPGENEPGQTPEGRTYVIGNYMLRCQQRKTGCPESGWTSLDSDDVLFTR